MIKRDDDVQGMTLACDECGDLLDGDFNGGQFVAMIEFAKSQGWAIAPDDDDEWTHTCPDCCGSAESRLDRARRLLGG